MKSNTLSLRFLFILIISSITFLIIVTLTYITSKQYKNDAIEQMIQHTTNASQDFTFAITDYIITENFSPLQEFVLAYRQNPHLLEITVANPDGIIIADYHPEHLGQIIAAVQSNKAKTTVTTVNTENDTIISLSPVILAGTAVGWCEFIVDTQHLSSSLHALQQKVFYWGFVIWLFAIMLAVAIATFVSRPINTILTFAQKVSSGNFNRKTDVSGPLEIRRLAAAFNTMTDELKRREHSLRLSENKFRALVEDINDIVWELDEKGNFSYASPAVEHVLGYKPKAMIGKPPSDFMSKTEAERVRNHFDPSQDQSKFDTFIATSLHKDGRSVILETSGRPIFTEDGEFKGYRGVDRDITDREEASLERKRLEQQLQQSQKMEAIGTLAGGIAHDFNNILGAILGYAELIKEELPENSPTVEDIEQVITAGHRAAELVEQILTFSRKTDTYRQPLRIDIIIKEALKMLRSSLPTSIEIETNIDVNCGLVYADATSIHQIIVNLCTNASHAIGNENGHLAISLNRLQLKSKQLPHNAQVRAGSFILLTVKDTGKGMDEKTKARIFEPYYTTKGLGEGTGLGLAVIHGIIEDYKGFIEVESTPGEGTVFQIYFPAIEDKITAPPTTFGHLPPPTGKEKILVVDDEPALVKLIKTILTRLGYHVETATSSIDALEIFKVSPDSFDLLITDQTMPGLTGTELAHAILEIKPELPVILCSGCAPSFSADKTPQLEVKHFIKKPLAKQKLAEVVRQVLDE